MRISELSSRSGVSIATIKFYVREGLLPGGTITGRNQADYSEEHLRRLHLVRALIDVGKLSVANARSVLAAVDTPGLPPHDLLKAAHCSLDRPNRRDPSHPDWQAARQVVLDLISRRGWYADETMAQVDVAADAVAAFHSLGQEDLLSCLDTYAEVVERVAEAELGAVASRGSAAGMVEGVVAGTILGEALLNALRRLAQHDASVRRFMAAQARAQAEAQELAQTQAQRTGPANPSPPAPNQRQVAAPQTVATLGPSHAAVAAASASAATAPNAELAPNV